MDEDREITFEVYDTLEGSVKDTVTRILTPHAGWQSVIYKGKRYKLWGGIRFPVRIYEDSPLKGRR